MVVAVRTQIRALSKRSYAEKWATATVANLTPLQVQTRANARLMKCTRM